MAEPRLCKVCDKPILKSHGGNLLINTYCSRFCYELETQGLIEERRISEENRVSYVLVTNCVWCGRKTNLSPKRPNAWLCGQECNILKSQQFGRRSNKKYLVFLCLQLHGPQTAAQLANFLGQIHSRYRFHHSTISQMLRPFVAKGLVIKHNHPTNPNKRGATYEIDHDLPLENLVPESL